MSMQLEIFQQIIEKIFAIGNRAKIWTHFEGIDISVHEYINEPVQENIIALNHQYFHPILHLFRMLVMIYRYLWCDFLYSCVGYCTEEDLSSAMPVPGPVQESQKEDDKKEEEEEEDETDEGIEEEEENAEKKEELW